MSACRPQCHFHRAHKLRCVVDAHVSKYGMDTMQVGLV